MQVVNEALKERLRNTLAGSQWEQCGIRHHHGIVAPLFSLHSAHSCGIGEYPDLLPLCSWCREIGFDIIQLLPLNDTGPETSPYSALSAHALNPIHLGLSQLPYVSQDSQLTQQIETLRQLNKSPRVAYKEVQKGKEQFLRAYCEKYGQKLFEDPECHAFLTNHPWVTEYALFKMLKIKHGWQNWESWPEPFRDPSPEFYRQIPPDLEKEIDTHILLQWLCFTQLHQVKEHAATSGLLIKGDIPILINWESDSIWYDRHLFNLDLIAGAPPDMYSKEGQKWGFPLYNWEALARQNYRWWLERLAVASRLYHIYRLDHIVGFFRIWAIPKEKPAKEGFFIPADKDAWMAQGEPVLKAMLAHCSMLPIGEDLGNVPTEVRECLRSMGVCGTKVMRWERRWEGDKSFIPPKEYPPENMTTVSTHDSETLQQWWEDFPEEARLFAEMGGWAYAPHLDQQVRFEILRACHHSNTLFHINLLQEYLALIPGMVSEVPAEERINLPGTVSEKNWSYRFKPSVEEIVSHPQLKQSMKMLLNG